MNETQQRIAHYKKLLPKMKERVIAVALLLALSLTMVTTVSFAWMVLSKAPEVTGVSTTIAANGNLEIALASGNRNNLTAPGASQVGDSGLELLQRNITWGNLINLTDPAYGLDNLVLRPAQLNDTALLTSPLYGAVYSTDGRIERLTSNFSYTAWIPAQGTTPGYFGISNDLGVRAISSVKRELVGFQGEYMAMREAADIANISAGNTFKNITENKEWMTSLATMMGAHMTATLNYEEQYINASVSQEDIKNLIAMYDAFINAFEMEAQAMANVLNMQLYLAWGGDTSKYTPFTDKQVLALTATSGNDYTYSANGKTLNLKNLKTFVNDYNMIVSDIEKLREISAGGDYRWTASGLKTIIGRLVNIDKCMVDGQTVKDLMSSFTSGISGMMGALNYKDKEVSCIITNGVLYNFEQRVGTSIKVGDDIQSGSKRGLPVTAKMYVDTMNLGEQVATLYATITTSATKPADFTQDLTHSDSLNTGADAGVGEVTAKDTYGLAVDFWVRTNAQGTHLILEGNLLTETKEEPAKGKNASGEEVDIYTLSRTETVTGEDGSPQSVTLTYELYKTVTKDSNGADVTTWYLHDDHSSFTLNEGENPVQKMNTITIVTGYEGENRVWEENALLNPDATTQGTGSCYVYYADTPEDQARSLRLLEAFNVAFVDQYGNLLATASMDTEHYFAESGRVTVPLVLSDGGIKLDETQYAITALEKNVPMLITALVYLDGTELTNDEVLAAADIQGQLNIQFGSSVDLNAIQNEDLATKERSVTASVSPTSFNYDTATTAMTSTVTVNVTGDQPNTVTAFFLRKINDAQGSREQIMTFTKGEGGTWTANYTFQYPGKYVLRSVMLDGVEYDLPMSDATPLPEVEVQGFTISSLTVAQANLANHVDILTAAGSSSVDVTLNFAANDASKMPSTVAGRFLRPDGTAANINFAYNPTTGAWVGKATFVTSGDYTLQYLVLNGEYEELPTNMQYTANVNLGMKVAVYTTSPTSFLYKRSDWVDADGNLTEEGEKMANLGMQIVIMNNAGEKMPGLTGVKLAYSKTGTSIVEEGFDADMTWNPLSQYYEGNIPSKVGMYSFLRVSVGSNTITNATISPNFMIASPVTPTFKEDVSADYQFAPKREATLQVNLKDCESATVNAIVTHQTGGAAIRELTIAGQLGLINGELATWVFALPKDQAQDGVWTIKEIRLSDVYSADGIRYTEENPLTYDLTGKAVSSKVVETVKVVIEKPANFDAELGKDGSTITGTFMQEYELSGLKVSFTDSMGQPIQATITASVVYDYLGDSQDKGGYSGAIGKEGVFTIALTSSDGKTFTQTGSQKVYLAGTYTAKLVYSINGMQVTILAEQMGESNLSFTIWSKTPTLTIDSISPNGQHNTVTSDKKNKTVESKIEGNTVTVYPDSKIDSNGCSGSLTQEPIVKLKLSNRGQASKVVLTFTTNNSDGLVHLYYGSNSKNGTNTTAYTWDSTTGDVVSRFVGYNDSGSCDESKAAGTLTSADYIELTYGDSTYVVPVSVITIVNTRP